MKPLKYLYVILASLGLAFSFSGCGDSSKTTSSADSKQPISIVFWEQDDVKSVQDELDALIKQFQAANPNIVVKRSHYETEELRKQFIAAGNSGGPDVVLGPNDNLGTFVAANIIQDMTSFMGADFFNGFEKDSLKSAQFLGKQYMIPDRHGNELMLIYNKALVTEAPQTMEQVLSIGAKLKSEGKIQYPLVFNKIEPFFSIPFYSAFGGKIFDDMSKEHPTPTFDTPATQQWMAYLLKLQTDGVIPKDCDGNVADSLFKEGKAAFIINGPWGLAGYRDAKLDVGMTAIPSINGKDSAALTAVKGYCVSVAVKDPAKVAAVKKFLAFMNSESSQVGMSLVHKQSPTLTAAINNAQIKNDPDIAAQLVPLEKGIPMPIVTEMRFVWDGIKPVQQEVFAGSTKPEDTPKAIQQRIEKGIEAAGIK